MKRKIITTADGSKTIFLPEQNEYYHSKHGAIQEAYHVFIKNGLDCFTNAKELSILEMGFGTGLNAFITFLESEKRQQKINYNGVEAYPIVDDEICSLNYVEQLNVQNYEGIFQKIHSVNWEKSQIISENFSLFKHQNEFHKLNYTEEFNLIYFDAFGVRVQPELWTQDIFQKMYNALKNKGVLTTYSAAGIVKRNLLSVGFKVEKLLGPPGKREMLKAFKKG